MYYKKTEVIYMNFEHIGIKVLDLEKSKKFYTEVLGCKIMHVYESPTSTLVFLDAHGVAIELIYSQKNKARQIGPVEHLAFKVANLAEKIAELKKLGIELDTEPLNIGDAKIAFFRGPNNERIEFMEGQLSKEL